MRHAPDHRHEDGNRDGDSRGDGHGRDERRRHENERSVRDSGQMTRRSATADENAEVALPRPEIKRTWWPYPMIWLIPIVIAILASGYLYRIYQDLGPLITLRVNNAGDLRPRETPVTVHGVEIGSIKSVGLSEDGKAGIVTVRLKKSAAQVARQNTVFWVQRADFTGGVIRGLSTIILGPHIEARPGDGAEAKDFVALDRPPIARPDGLKVLLKTPRLPHVEIESPVYYRGMAVGRVQDIRLGDDARTVNVTIFIEDAYTPLIRSNSRFWVVKGTDVEGGLLTGLQVRVESLRALVSGGVEFATPDDSGYTPGPDEGWFDLHDGPKEEWLKWQPELKFKSDQLKVPDIKGQTPLDIR